MPDRTVGLTWLIFVLTYAGLALGKVPGLRMDRARASIRFSLGKQNTADDIDLALALVPETIARLRELSPAYKRQAVGS